MNLSVRVLTYLLVILLSLPASAQQMGGGMYMQAGTGMAGAVQGCPGGGMQIPPGARDALDDVKQRQRELNELKAKVSKLEREKSKAEADRDRAKENLEDVLDGQWVDIFSDHIDNQISCVNYKVHPTCGGSISTCPNGNCDDSKSKVDAGVSSRAEAKTCGRGTVKPNQGVVWNQVCDNEQPGNISAAAACDQEAVYVKGIEGRAKGKCISALQKYQAASAKVRKLDNQLARYGDDKLDRATDRIDNAKRRFEDAITQYQTEGQFCYECQTGGAVGAAPERRFDWGTLLAGSAVGVIATVAGLKAEQNRAYYNAQIGFPTNETYPSFMYGMPFFLNGFYGAMAGGVSAGGFACGGGGGMGGGGFGGGGFGGPGGGGAFGYPPGIAGPIGGPAGGGIYLPGGGMPGMGGGMGYPGGYPGMGGGAGFPGVIGGGFGGGFPGMGGGMGGGFPGGGGMGYPGMGGGIGGGIGFPGMGGGGYGGIPGMGGAYPGMGGGMGYPGGFPGMGGGIGGGIGFPGGGMGGGFPGMGGGMGYPGGYPGMGGGMGYPGMGYPGMGGGMGGGMGYPGMGGGMGGGLDGGGYQQQLMQMQMQAYQEQLQMQVRVQENAIQRQRVASGLVQEMMGLQIRLQCVQSGANCGGNYLGSGISNGIPGGGSGPLIPTNSVPGGGFTPPPGTSPGGPNNGGGGGGSNNGGYVR